VGFIRPIEGHLMADREGLCSTQLEPSSTQVQQASPEEATNAPTEEQEKDLHEEGAPPSILDIPTASNSSHDQDQPTHEVSDDVLNDDQGHVDGQDGDQNDQDDQVISQRSNEVIKARRKRRVARNLELSGHTLENVIADLRGNVSTRGQLAKFSNHQAYISMIEPKKVFKALEDPDWLDDMHEELNNFKCNNVCCVSREA
jgi:hypothetical protein